MVRFHPKVCIAAIYSTPTPFLKAPSSTVMSIYRQQTWRPVSSLYTVSIPEGHTSTLAPLPANHTFFEPRAPRQLYTSFSPFSKQDGLYLVPKSQAGSTCATRRWPPPPSARPRCRQTGPCSFPQGHTCTRRRRRWPCPCRRGTCSTRTRTTAWPSRRPA